jgi:hypothetical protein
MELTAIEKNKIAKFDAMNAARDAGYPEVVLMILSDQIAVRSRRSGNWSIRDYQREVHEGLSHWSMWTTRPASPSTT